ncbi:MAG TPA: metallophosphoesterase [Bryobacteraceae bacterium]|nr:metallophosphoesterase [Bryobacteraceae bacterium]
MAAFTLAHVSDPHLPPLPRPRPLELMGKRVFGYLNWTRNRHRYHRRDVVDVLMSDLQAQVPDHIAITGDLVNLALEAEFSPALSWLKSIGPPGRVTVIPGNHDTYVRATRNHFAKTFASYLAADDATADGEAFPALRRRGPLALVGVSSAVPTPPLMATGWLGTRQTEALEHLLAALAAEPVFRILLIHHPLRSTARSKRLTDSPDLLALLKRYGVEMVLHGHDHVHSTIRVDGPNGSSIPAIGVPSASAYAHGHYPHAAYNLFSIARDGDGWRCQQAVRGINDALQVREIRRVRLF